MSATPPDAPVPATQPPGTISCARCGAEVPPEADWCLSCGLAARTRIAPTPRWRVPLVALAVIGALALAALAVAFVDLTEDPEPAATTAPTTATTPVPVPAPVPAPTTLPAPSPAPTTTPGAEPIVPAPATTEPTVPEATTPGAAEAPAEPEAE